MGRRKKQVPVGVEAKAPAPVARQGEEVRAAAPAPTPADTVASVITRIRTERGLSKYRLAKLTGLGEGFIGYLESGRSSPSIDTARKIAAALGVSLAVFDGTGEVP